MSIDLLAGPLRPHYSRFLTGAGGDVLLTGHSHQAWPDVSRDAQLEAWDDAARFADRKWDRIMGEILPGFQASVAKRIGSSRPADLAIAPNTHELVYRLSSCFPPGATVVTTDQEFHSVRRQLARLEEDGAHIVRVPVQGEGAFADRFALALEQHRPAWAALSMVLYTTARVLDVQAVLQAAAALKIPVLVDAYHAFNVVPIEAGTWPGEVFVTGGGYKYAECGEGACWMLLPEDATRFRPRTTGWFADFGSLERASDTVGYGPGGQRFFGSTFDPTGIYRAHRVLEWMDRTGLDVAALRAQSLRQTDAIITGASQRGLLEKLGLATPRAAAERGGFVAFTHENALDLVRALAARGIRTDARPPNLRLGPAPYTTTAELDRALDALAAVL